MSLILDWDISCPVLRAAGRPADTILLPQSKRHASKTRSKKIPPSRSTKKQTEHDTFLYSTDSALSHELHELEHPAPKQIQPREQEKSDEPEHFKFRLDTSKSKRHHIHVAEAEAERRYKKLQSDTSKLYSNKKKDEIYIIFGDKECKMIRQTLKQFGVATIAENDHTETNVDRYREEESNSSSVLALPHLAINKDKLAEFDMSYKELKQS